MLHGSRELSCDRAETISPRDRQNGKQLCRQVNDPSGVQNMYTTATLVAPLIGVLPVGYMDFRRVSIDFTYCPVVGPLLTWEKACLSPQVHTDL